MMRLVTALLLLTLACGPAPNVPHVSREPISVRGWISGPPLSFQSTNLWIDDAPYVSGGVAPNGAFILLDVPPGNTTITFSAPGAPAAKLVLQNIPGNADLFIPGLVLRHDSVALLDPNGVLVRLAAHVPRPMPAGAMATVAGIQVPVMKTPYAAMMDRRDYPNPPGAPVPLATVR